MPHAEKDKSVNQKFDEMKIVNEENFESSYLTTRLPVLFGHDDEISFPAMKMEKNEPPLLHKNFYNNFIDFMNPLKTLK
ncbi:hypothetical protein M3Y98_01064500 [Aphelenchoides besseyi]|nr:hypothetical protein M3Y98_01064500 [Aphelenchoides besseyi]